MAGLRLLYTPSVGRTIQFQLVLQTVFRVLLLIQQLVTNLVKSGELVLRLLPNIQGTAVLSFAQMPKYLGKMHSGKEAFVMMTNISADSELQIPISASERRSVLRVPTAISWVAFIFLYSCRAPNFGGDSVCGSPY